MKKKIEIKTIRVDEIMNYFKEQGIEISKKEAEFIIQFINTLTIITLEHFLKDIIS